PHQAPGCRKFALTQEHVPQGSERNAQCPIVADRAGQSQTLVESSPRGGVVRLRQGEPAQEVQRQSLVDAMTGSARGGQTVGEVVVRSSILSLMQGDEAEVHE